MKPLLEKKSRGNSKQIFTPFFYSTGFGILSVKHKIKNQRISWYIKSLNYMYI